MLDPVTGLYNRRFVEEHLSGELARSNGHDRSLTVAALHLKDFEQIIGSYGRAAGDLVLKYFGAELKKAIRSSDIAARTGQDEFMVLFPEGRPEQVPATLLRLADLEVELRGEKIPVGFAAGLTAYQPGDSAAKLLDRAEQAVLAEKPTVQHEPEILEALSAVSSVAEDGVAEALGMQGSPQPEQVADAGQRAHRASARSAKPGRPATRRRRANPAAAPVGEFAALAAAGLRPRSSDEPQSA